MYFILYVGDLAPPCHSPAAGALPRLSDFDINFILSECAAQFGQTCLKQTSLKENKELTLRESEYSDSFQQFKHHRMLVFHNTLP